MLGTNTYTHDSLRNELGAEIIYSNLEDFHLENLNCDELGYACSLMIQNSVRDFLLSQWSRSLCSSKAAIDICWEKINSGHWKDVNISWRHAYYICSYIKALCEFSCTRNSANIKCNDSAEAMKTCDMGILLGAPSLDGILPKLATKLSEFQKGICMYDGRLSLNEEKLNDAGDGEDIKDLNLSSEHLIERLKCPSLEVFYADMKSERPVILTDAISFWPAFNERKWTLNYIRSVAGSRLVPVEIGSKYTEDSWSQSLITVNEFIDNYLDIRTSDFSGSGSSDKTSVTKPIGYLAQHQLFHQIPELRSDISIPSYCGISLDESSQLDDDDVDINAWFGPAGTVSPLHTDPKRNLLAQVVGQKYFRLYSIQYDVNMYPHEDAMLSNTSQVDCESPDLVRFPLFADAEYVEGILRPGELLYIPPKCWHYIRSLSVSFSVSFWWR